MLLPICHVMHQNIEKQREIYRTKRRKDPNLEGQRNFEKQLINKGLHAGESVDLIQFFIHTI